MSRDVGPGSGRTWRCCWWVCAQSRSSLRQAPRTRPRGLTTLLVVGQWVGSGRALGTEIQSCEPLCGRHRESWWHPRSGYCGGDKREARGCLRGWDFKFPWDFRYLCHLLPSASLPWSHPALCMYCWLARPAWNSSRPTRSGCRTWEPGSVLHKFARVVGTTWVLAGFLNCFLPCFMLSEMFHVLCIWSFQLRWKVIGVITNILSLRKMRPEKLADIWFVFRARRGSRSACFYSPGQVGSCQDSTVSLQKRKASHRDDKCASSSWVGGERPSRVLPKPYKASGLGERRSEGSWQP